MTAWLIQHFYESGFIGKRSLSLNPLYIGGKFEQENMAVKLRPEPSKVKRKPRGLGIKDLEPSDPFFKPVDLTTCKCSGLLHGEGVLVTHPEFIWALVGLGSYGRGIFSRSVPSHHHIPSLEELKFGKRKRGQPARSSEEIEETWRKRIKLHSQWTGETSEDLLDVKMTEGDEQSSSDLMLPLETDLVPAKGDPVSSVEAVESDSYPIVNDEKSYSEFVQRLQEMQRSDPLCLEEYLQLGAEEAFYLAADAKVLNVQNAAMNNTLTLCELWQHFTQTQKTFPARYAAYVHYRNGNWVPKSGLKFGVDFVLYKESPLSYHSSFAVIVKEERTVQGEWKGLTWKEIVALNRVSESASKDLLFCHVKTPSGEESLKYPACLLSMSVKDTIIKRWVPEKDRENVMIVH